MGSVNMRRGKKIVVEMGGKKRPGRKKSELKDNQISLREVRSKN
jgi:hypothetical protein